MNKEDVISEIKKDYEKSQSGIFLLSVSCVLMSLGLLGIAIYPEYTVFGIIGKIRIQPRLHIKNGIFQ